MRKFKRIFTFSFLIISLGCNTDDNRSSEAPFEVSKLLSDTTDAVIVPTIVAFNTQAKRFNEGVGIYIETTTEDNLMAVRQQWIQMALSYERTYNFHIGEIRARFLHQAIYNWPTVDTSIEDFITNEEVTEQSVASISPQIKALAGLEYLLFKGDITSTHQEFIDSAERLEYLRLASAFIMTQADRLLNIWDSDGEDYASTFKNSDATGIEGSFNLLFNGLNNAVDTGKVTKIGKPAGLEKSPITNPDIVQAPYSNQSLDLLLQSIETVEEVFFSSGRTDISDYIFSISKNNELNDEIQVAIDEVKQAIANIPVSLEEAVDSHQTEVLDLHTKLTHLTVLLSVDARSVLSVIITSTDNDGD